MLSQNLKSLADELRKFTIDGAQIEAPAMNAIVAVLDVAVEDAQHLESRTIPINDQIAQGAADNVVRFRPLRLAKGGPNQPDPGDAA